MCACACSLRHGRQERQRHAAPSPRLPPYDPTPFPSTKPSGLLSTPPPPHCAVKQTAPPHCTLLLAPRAPLPRLASLLLVRRFPLCKTVDEPTETDTPRVHTLHKGGAEAATRAHQAQCAAALCVRPPASTCSPPLPPPCLVRALGLLVAADLKVLAALDRLHRGALALGALQAQHDLLRRLGLLVEHGLGLAAEARLLAVVAALACREG